MLPKLQRQLNAFLLLPTELQQKHTITILEGVQEHNGYLRSLYEYVISGKASIENYKDIYTAALETQEDIEITQFSAKISKFSAIQSRLQTKLLQEQGEKAIVQGNLNTIINAIP